MASPKQFTHTRHALKAKTNGLKVPSRAHAPRFESGDDGMHTYAAVKANTNGFAETIHAHASRFESEDEWLESEDEWLESSSTPLFSPGRSF
jgi:hypothetical protein